LVLGSSSGAVLALDAASKLGPKVSRLFLYEPPLIVDRGNDAVKLFFARGMGIPEGAVNMMRLFMPGWSKMAALAPTIRYDLTILAGTQTGKPLDAGRWAATTAPTLVVVGSRSEAFFHHGAEALAAILPHAQYRSLEGRDHSAVLLAPQALASVAEPFFLAATPR